jgi:hypothetical protein
LLLLLLLLLLLDGKLSAELAKGANLFFPLLFAFAFCLAIELSRSLSLSVCRSRRHRLVSTCWSGCTSGHALPLPVSLYSARSELPTVWRGAARNFRDEACTSCTTSCYRHPTLLQFSSLEAVDSW